MVCAIHKNQRIIAFLCAIIVYSMAILYPHKQTVIIFIVCVVVVGAVTWYSHGLNITQIQNQKGTNTTASANIDQISTTDVSNDWQKQFFGSATSSVKLSAKKPANTTAETPLSFTDQLGRDYFSQYMMAMQAGLDSDPNVTNSINNRFIERVANAANPTIYSMKDIYLISDKNIEVITNYKKNLTYTLQNMPSDDAATIANDAFNNGDMESLSKIDRIVNGYEAVAMSLRTMPVPQSVAQYHLDLLNGISITLYNAKSLRNVEKDPVQGLAAVGIYIVGLENISTALNNIQQKIWQ